MSSENPNFQKIANCPYLRQTVSDAVGAAMEKPKPFYTQRECDNCKNNEVLVTPSPDKRKFSGTQNFELKIRPTKVVPETKYDIETGCKFDPNS